MWDDHVISSTRPVERVRLPPDGVSNHRQMSIRHLSLVRRRYRGRVEYPFTLRGASSF